MSHFENEYRSPGYWLDARERMESGMCPECGEWLKLEEICPCKEDCDCATEYANMQRDYLAADWQDAEEGLGSYVKSPTI